MPKVYDFQGWATRSGIRRSDGLTIMPSAFAHNNGKKVPIIWNHDHGDPTNILGYGILEHRDGGVWVKGIFNDTDKGQIAKELTQSGDVDSLSIFAAQLQKVGKQVTDGDIKEVSLVVAGANPEAKIETVLSHSEDGTEDAYIRFIGEDNRLLVSNTLSHSEDEEDEYEEESTMDLEQILGTLNEEQQEAVALLLDRTLS